MYNLDTSDHQYTDIFIFSDSQSALRALDSYSTNSVTIADCRKSLNEMATHLRINLNHRNIVGNCIADELARQGTTVDILRVGTRWVCPCPPAPPQAKVVHPLQQPEEHDLNMPHFQVHLTKL